MALAGVPSPKDDADAFEIGKSMKTIPLDFVTNLRRIHGSEVLQPERAKQRLFHLLRGVRETHGGKFPPHLPAGTLKSLNDQYSALADACIPVASR